MPTPIPKIIRNFNLMVDGVGYAGRCESVTLPDFSIKEEEHRAGGMDMPIGIDMGMDKMELKFSMSEHSPTIFRLFGLADGNGVSATFRAAKSDDKTVETYIVQARGALRKLTPGEVRIGDKSPVEAMIALRYIKVTMNGQDVIEIDVDNMVRKIGGADQLQGIRNAISM